MNEIDEEWDIERILETNAATISLVALGLGWFKRGWNIVPMVISGFLLQHALQGWCPPVPILRRLGVRTMKEIDKERYALKAIRGDFAEVNEESADDSCVLADRALEAAK